MYSLKRNLPNTLLELITPFCPVNRKATFSKQTLPLRAVQLIETIMPEAAKPWNRGKWTRKGQNRVQPNRKVETRGSLRKLSLPAKFFCTKPLLFVPLEWDRIADELCSLTSERARETSQKGSEIWRRLKISRENRENWRRVKKIGGERAAEQSTSLGLTRRGKRKVIGKCGDKDLGTRRTRKFRWADMTSWETRWTGSSRILDMRADRLN